jgi:hypothetical protein
MTGFDGRRVTDEGERRGPGQTDIEAQIPDALKHLLQDSEIVRPEANLNFKASDYLPEIVQQVGEAERTVAKHSKLIANLESDLNKLIPVYLPEGYEPIAERFGEQRSTVEVKSGVMPGVPRIRIEFTPPKRGWIFGEPATLRGVIEVDGRDLPLAPVKISAAGQFQLDRDNRNFGDRRWSHERICEEVAQYVFLICRETIKFVRQHQVKNPDDFDPDFEAHLVRQVAMVTNLLQLPEYYRGFVDKECATLMAGELSQRVSETGAAIKAEAKGVKDGLKTLMQRLEGAEVVTQLEMRFKERVERSLAEVSSRAEGEAVKVLKGEIRRLEKVKQGLEGEIAELSKKIDQHLSKDDEAKLRIDLVTTLREIFPDLRDAHIVTLMQRISDLYLDKRYEINMDLDNFKEIYRTAVKKSGLHKLNNLLYTESEQLLAVERLIAKLPATQAKAAIKAIDESRSRELRALQLLLEALFK